MSSQFSIPVPNLDLNSFELPPPLPLMAPPMANAISPTATTAVTTQKNDGNGTPVEPMLTNAPSAPLLQPAQPVPVLYQTEGAPIYSQATALGPLSTATPRQLRQHPLGQLANAASRVGSKHVHVTSTAPQKGDIAYKTSPCRHFTRYNGWCPWGDDCGL